MSAGAARAPSRILTTLYFPQRARWVARSQMIDRAGLTPAQVLRRLVREAGPDDVVILDGGVGKREGYVDRVAAGLLARRRHPPRVVMTDSTWAPGRGRRAALRLVDSSRVTYCVLSASERASFPRTWGVDPGRVVFTPFYWTLPEPPVRQLEGAGVFAGGNSLRDHDTLLAAAARLDIPITVATRSRPRRAVPANVTLGPVPAGAFLDAMGASAVVVVALQPGLVRSAGQQTYLNAMALGKLLVVSDAPGVRDHVTHGQTGLVVSPGNPDALAATLRWATDPANGPACANIARRGRDVAVDRFSPERYVDRLLDVVDALR